MNLQGKTAVITGGSSGIGARIAERFAKEGANVVIGYNNNTEGANKTVATIEALGLKAFAYQGDISVEVQTKGLIDCAIEKFGTIDILINNAGKYIDGDEWNGSSDIWLRTLQNNLIGAMNMSKYASNKFIAQKSGVIVSIASRLGVLGNPDELAYGAAKAGIINMTQAYAKLLAPFGRANSISPGAVNTGYWLRASQAELATHLANNPLGRLIEVDEVADTVLFLCSDESKSITGQNIVVGGGYMRK